MTTNERADAASRGKRKPYKDRALKVRTVSKRKAAGMKSTRKRAKS